MPKFQSFWFGEGLTPYQRLAMQSFIDFGHSYVLYSYKKFDTPAGVELRDANEILPQSRLFFYGPRAEAGHGSVAAFSNLFRYQLLLQVGGWWVDTDVVCLSDVTPSTEIFMGWEYDDLIGNAILKFPARHWFMEEMRDAAECAGTDLKWGETGPLLLTRLAHERKLLDLVSPQPVAYPVQSEAALHLLLPHQRDPIRARISHAPFLHMWNEAMRRAVLVSWMAPPPDSLIAELFERHRVGFGDMPGYTAEQVQRLNDNLYAFTYWERDQKRAVALNAQLDAEKAESARLAAQVTELNLQKTELNLQKTELDRQTHDDQDRLRALEGELLAVRSDLAEQIQHVQRFIASASWRLTAPLRAVRSLLSRTGPVKVAQEESAAPVPVAQGESAAPAGLDDGPTADLNFICGPHQRRIYIDRDDERARALGEAGGDFNPKSLAMWRSLVVESEWTHIVDVGANYGEMLVGVDLPRCAKIIAIEPSPYVFRCLSRTLQESGLDVQVVEAAASDHCGEVAINIDRTWSGKSSVIAGQSLSEGHVLERHMVPAMTLDALIARPAEGGIRLLVKIDVEGHEAAVLRGLGRLLLEAEDFTALVEILHLSNEDLDWIVSHFSVALRDLRNHCLVLVDPRNAQDMRDLLLDDRYYPQDVVLRRQDWSFRGAA